MSDPRKANHVLEALKAEANRLRGELHRTKPGFMRSKRLGKLIKGMERKIERLKTGPW